MPRPPLSRFNTELEILAAIDQKTEFVKRLRFRSQTWDQKANILFDAINPWPDSERKENKARDARAMREKATRMRNRADRIERNYLSRLKGRLAVFRTGQLPGINNHDPSIPK